LPGRNPREAVENFLDPLRDALACVANDKITTSSGGRGQPGRVHWWSINGREGVELSRTFRLKAQMHYEIIEDAENGPWRVTTRGYLYGVERADGRELVGAHWHPNSQSRHVEPHLHFSNLVTSQEGAFLARHPIYTGRVTFEWVIRFAVENLGAAPKVTDWATRLERTEGPHRENRTWHQTPSEATPEN
jgi:hypothetical protein